MRRSNSLSIAVLVAMAFLSAETGAAEGRKVPPGPPAAGQPPAGGATAAPLKGEIRLPPGMYLGGMRALHVGFDTLNQKFTEFSGSAKTYEAGTKAMPGIAKACSAKTYSVQEQIAAGCTLNETLKQCTDKLYKHCIETYSIKWELPGFGVNPVTGQQLGGGSGNFSTKQFEQSAQSAAAQARALSQLLGQYANEVEQTAKALVP